MLLLSICLSSGESVSNSQLLLSRRLAATFPLQEWPRLHSPARAQEPVRDQSKTSQELQQSEARHFFLPKGGGNLWEKHGEKGIFLPRAGLSGASINFLETAG